MTTDYPMSGAIIGKDPIVYKGNRFIWNEDLNKWELEEK